MAQPRSQQIALDPHPTTTASADVFDGPTSEALIVLQTSHMNTEVALLKSGSTDSQMLSLSTL